MKIITWNIANYNDHPNWERRVKLLAKELADYQPDVIAIQEVRFCMDSIATVKTGMNTGEQLLFELNELGWGIGYHIRSAPAMFYSDTRYTMPRNYPIPSFLNKGTEVMWEGLAVISRFPIIESSNYILNPTPPECDRNIRNVQKVVTGGVTLYNTHLSYNPQEAVQNARVMLDYIRINNAESAIVCGDFNTEPDEKAISLMEKADFVSVGKVEVTHPVPNPFKKIDYFFVEKMLLSQVDSCRLIGTDCDETGLYPSDHFGLLLEIKI
jgi:endonuclease/exonuclease/phosphatase family metal-dependent hydrolase